jgi:tRNA A-37 threonylcarbamoyl transferase component Bud32
MPNPPSSPKFTKIARYEILREIGRGGMATVYLARDPNFQREVAIKVLPHEALHDSTLYQRFQREARTIASLEHPAIVPVYDFGEEDGQPFLVMRYLNGGSLSAKIKAGPLPVAEAAKVMLRIGDALDAAHAKGIVHRDLKPANILFDQYGNAYLSDFGIAQLSEATSPLTGSAILGTPAYMSPEQIRGDGKVDGRADIYALGIVLFEMLTGKTPFKADTPAQMMMMHLANPTPRLPEEKSDLPDTINGVLIRAMAKDPDLRFQKASELGSVISAIASGQAPDLSQTSATYGYLKETSATRIDDEDGGPRRPSRTAKKAAGEEPAGKSAKKWPAIAIAAAVVLCLCGIGGAAGGYALYKNPDALSALLSPKGTATVTVLSPTEKYFSGLDFTPTIEVVNSGGDAGPTVDTSKLVGDKFEISIGDEVSNGVPGPGAGNIESPGVKDIYTFAAQAGQTVFFQVVEHEMDKSGVQTNWMLSDERGVKIFDKCIGCGNPGKKVLEAGGTYTIIVGSGDHVEMGTYKFKLWNVPPPETFSIAIGDDISNGVPGPGAGNMETAGAEDIYTFMAQAGQVVFFQFVDSTLDKHAVQTIWRLVDERGAKLFDRCLGCNNPGKLILEHGGTYTITVGSDDLVELGTYKFKIWNVPPPETFSISIGSEISNGVPGPGAGNMETAGAEDIYTFTAKAGQTVFFQAGNKTLDKSGMQTIWTLTDERGAKLFSKCIGCGNPGEILLDYGGTYTITVGSDDHVELGTYTFKLWSVSSTSLLRSKSSPHEIELLLLPDPTFSC